MLYELNCESLSVLSQPAPTLLLLLTCGVVKQLIYKKKSFCSSQKYEVSQIYAKRIVSYTVALVTHVWKFQSSSEGNRCSFLMTQWSRHNIGPILYPSRIIPVSLGSIFVSLKIPSPSGSVTKTYSVPLCQIFIFISLIQLTDVKQAHEAR